MAPVTAGIYTSQGKMCSSVQWCFFFFFLHRVKRFFCLMCNTGKCISVHKFLRISHVLILSTVNHLSSSPNLQDETALSKRCVAQSTAVMSVRPDFSDLQWNMDTL